MYMYVHTQWPWARDSKYITGHSLKEQGWLVYMYIDVIFTHVHHWKLDSTSPGCWTAYNGVCLLRTTSGQNKNVLIKGGVRISVLYTSTAGAIDNVSVLVSMYMYMYMYTARATESAQN